VLKPRRELRTSSTAGFIACNKAHRVDGFLVFLNLSGDTKSAPVEVVIQFGIDGETIDPLTLHALNGTDVTGLFVPGSQSPQMVAIFNWDDTTCNREKRIDYQH
jgi:hypothetical protein